MGKLAILGAQRVKALAEMLKEQRDRKLVELNKQKPTRKEAEKEADKTFGVLELTEEVDKLTEKLRDISAPLENKTGRSIAVDYRNIYRGSALSKYNDEVNRIMDAGVEGDVGVVKEEYRKKEQMLWLCETLEDAKKIVGLDE